MTNNTAPVQPFDLAAWRGQFIRLVLRIASVLGVVLIGTSFPTAALRDRLIFIALYLVLLSITLLPVPYGIRAYLFLAMPAVIGINAILAWGPWADGTIFLLTTVILAALLLDNRTDAALLAVSVLFLLSIAYLTEAGSLRLISPGAPNTTSSDWGVYIADFAIAGLVIISAANMLKGAFSKVTNQMTDAYRSLSLERQNLEDKVQERTAELETRMTQLRASTSTARVIAETREVSNLLETAVGLIAEQFEYYHVGIFILDETKRNAYLQSASSDTGRALMGQIFRIEQERRNPLAYVVQNKKAYIIHDVDKVNFIQDANFPLTRSRMVIPLTVRGELAGLLDIHSDQPRATTPQDAEILQTLADLIAISFDNARLLNETKNLLAQLEAGAALQTEQTWSKFTSRQKNAYLYTPAGVRPVFAKIRTVEQGEGMHVPILLHGRQIGKIRLRKRKGESEAWSARERDLIEKITTQVALALENNRLVDEAQRNALRNQMIANFSTQVRETLNVEIVARTAAAELQKVFDLKEAEISIGIIQSDSSRLTQEVRD